MDGYGIYIGRDLSVNPEAVISLEDMHRQLVEIPIRRLLSKGIAERVLSETPLERLEGLSDELVRQRGLARSYGRP